MTLRIVLRALAHRNFRLFFVGQAVSLVGTWMQQVALAWLVYELTHSPALLGAAAFAGQIPSLVVSPLAGVLMERWNKHRVLMVTQALAMLQAFALAVLALTGNIEVWQIMVLSVFFGVVTSFDMTCRQSFITQIVDRRENLANAIALNSTIVNAARMVGPALAALLLHETSAGVCFLANGVSYLAVLAALSRIRLTPRPLPARAPLLEGFRQGLRYAYEFHPIRAVLSLLALISLTGLSYTVLLPVVATEVLGGSARTYGFLCAATGVGALVGAVMLAGRKTVRGLGRWIAYSSGLLGVGTAALALAPGIWTSFALLLLVGFAHMMMIASSNSVLQTIVDEDKRARVMSLYTAAFLGVAPLGNLMTGWLAEHFGAPIALILIGLCSLLGSLSFARQVPIIREIVRPLYQRLGILPPPVAAAIQSVNELTIPPRSQ